MPACSSHRNVILGEDHARCVACWALADLKLHCGRTWASHSGQVSRQFFLVELDDRPGRAILSTIITSDVDALHKIKNRHPSLFIKPVLKDVVWLVATGAVVPKNLLQSSIIGGIFRQ